MNKNQHQQTYYELQINGRENYQIYQNIGGNVSKFYR